MNNITRENIRERILAIV